MSPPWLMPDVLVPKPGECWGSSLVRKVGGMRRDGISPPILGPLFLGAKELLASGSGWGPAKYLRFTPNPCLPPGCIAGACRLRGAQASCWQWGGRGPPFGTSLGLSLLVIQAQARGGAGFGVPKLTLMEGWGVPTSPSPWDSLQPVGLMGAAAAP